MKSFEYGDGDISERELMFAVSSMVIGVSVLSLPNQLARATIGSDGWISLLIGGMAVIAVTWLATKLAAGFPKQTFLTYATSIVTRPIAIVLTFVFAIISLCVASYVVRAVASISEQFLFKRTPIEVISLLFLLVVVYAVSGSRVGLLRLNILFLPIIISIVVAVFIFNIRWIDFNDFLPIFETNATGYIKGIGASSLSYMGFGIILFYVALVERPEKAPKMAVYGMFIPIILYMLIYLMSIGVFGNSGTSYLRYPTIELAKRVEIPGGLFERVESVFFVIWTMAIFNTAAMAFDVAVLAVNSIFKRAQKIKIVFIISPIIYYLSMLPENYAQLLRATTFVGYFAIPFTTTVTVLLLVIGKIRGVKRIE